MNSGISKLSSLAGINLVVLLLMLTLVEFAVTIYKELSVLEKAPLIEKPFFDASLDVDTVADFYPNRYLGYRHPPNIEIGRKNLSAGALPSEFADTYTVEDLVLRTDEWGFIKTLGEAISPFDMDSSRLKIVLLGGSTMAGWGASYAESIPSHLWQMLEDYGMDATVINAGVVGYYLFQEFQYYALELSHLRPDVVIFLDGLNDGWGSREYLPSLTHSTVQKDDTGFAEQPRVLSEFYELLEALMPNTTSAIKGYLLKPPEDGKDYFDKLHASYGVQMTSILNQAAAIAQNDDTFFVAGLQPILDTKRKNMLSDYEQSISAWHNLQHNLSNYAPIRDAYAQFGSNFGNTSSVQVLDLIEVFASTSETVYFDRAHYTSEGNRIIAQQFFDAITANLDQIEHLRAKRQLKAPIKQ